MDNQGKNYTGLERSKKEKRKKKNEPAQVTTYDGKCLENVEYSFLTITLKSTLIRSASTS